MALTAQLPLVEMANAAARALEALLGHDVVLTASEPVVARLDAGLLPGADARAIAVPVVGPVRGDLVLVAAARFALAMEAAAPEASLLTASLPALDGAAAAAGLPASTADGAELSLDTLLDAVDDEFGCVLILENDEQVAALLVRAFAGETGARELPPESPAPAPATIAVSEGTVARLEAPPAVARHEFQSLRDGANNFGPTRPITLLNDVEMEVVAELGRRRVSVRELTALCPGVVIELDRAAGSPVDVLVNGSLLAHGEVVVIDEEFGVRIAEIIVGET